ncbi:hypothetical protein KO317_01560 [Candidatus Micrarchaeota archaeon]|nr:hypothetical protein [Candidatus Micrarchaeota archaeon]
MKLERRTRWAIIIVLAILALIIAIYIYSSNSSNNIDGFLSNLKESKEVALIMDTRESNSLELNHKIMTCGIGIAQGNGLVGKQTTIYGIEDTICYISYPNDTHNANATIQECENEIKNKIQIHIQSGKEDKTIFEANKMKIYISETYEGSCMLQIQ